MSVAVGAIACAGVDYFLLLIDSAFPQSQPRIAAPQADREYSWPHVEPGGLLCLKSTMVNSDPGHRMLQHISWALELLNLPQEVRRREFEREFSTYWNRRATETHELLAMSLLAPEGPSREIVSFLDIPSKRVVVAEDRASLKAWLRHSGRNPSDKQLHPGWLEWLTRPWTPDEFPEYGRDVLRLAPRVAAGHFLHPGRYCTVVFGTETATGVVFAGTLLRGDSEKELVKGFRSLSHVPAARIENSFAARAIIRCPVSRVDGSWIHGRDHNPAFPSISKRKVAFIGCGALGASIARLLAQAGIADFILVDADLLTSANTSRHVLGQRFIGKHKAVATAEMLKEDFPHIASAVSIPLRFDALSISQMENISECDIIVSAGIDYEGDAQIDIWRRALRQQPVHVCAWAEAFAIVGHAIALFGEDRLLDAFDNEEQVRFRLTDWSKESRTMVVEAGCGNVFQPHGAVELQATVTTAAGLALDVLCGKVSRSVRRVWQGDPAEVTKRGGTALSAFADSLCVKEFPWR